MTRQQYLGRVFAGALLLLPGVAFAAPANFRELVALFLGLLNQVSALLFSVALLIFFWGLVKFIYAPGGEGYSEGRDMMVWGIVGLFVLVALFGLTKLFTQIITG